MTQRDKPQKRPPKSGGPGRSPNIPPAFEQTARARRGRAQNESEQHIYVVGMDDFNLHEMEGITENPDYSHCRFHALLDYDELGQTDAVSRNELLEHVELPGEIARVDGCWCLAVAVISGEQCSVEGYCYEGRVYIHGIIDSVNERDSSSVTRYQYPSHLPEDVLEWLRELSMRLKDLGYMHAPFSIEYFYQPETG